ncbi:hypothetical protein PROFUN_08317 [Planoprotostelium fungivorum]|uniref:CAP-Gly domain-containing protein n=1 Tax=Planoprotostelium fungivorum TaxID=1890364 RepID=A0A2P6NI30_9EUKA|nr:hypothetical protein PROFUN_08317 [Planoprotostelium fungivorum]
MAETYRVDVTHSVLCPNGPGNRKTFPATITIGALKEKIHLFFGTDPQFQKLELRVDGNTTVEMNDDNATLATYNPADYQELHVIDTDPSNQIGNLQDISKVEKYVMSEEAYSQRENTYRKHKEEETRQKQQAEEPFPDHIKVGDKVIVPGTEGAESRNGTVAYVGAVDGSKGFWIGLIFDGPNGKNDGSVKGKRYFTCEPNHGGFVKPNKVVLQQ